MKITVLNDIRNLKKDTVYDFSILSEMKQIVIIGENGSGKSTILQALRGSLQYKVSDSLYERDFKDLSKSFSFEHNYDKIFFLDSVKDNPFDFNVAYDATNLVTSGGFNSRHNSHGEVSLNLVSKLLSDIDVFRSKNQNSKILVVLDEVDKGFSIEKQSKFINVIDYINQKFNVDILCISHNPFLISRSLCFDISTNDFILGSKYIEEKCGFTIRQKSITQE
jgi:ABC-type Mn2+/Zn2+ transport system ATPase subunit